MKRSVWQFLLLSVVTFALSGGASASLLDFVIPAAQGGSHIIYSGTGGALVGSNISIKQLLAFDMPEHSGTYQCIGCFLNFRTGNYTGGGSGGWNFAGGPGTFITISGCVDVDRDGGPCDSDDIKSANLISGQLGVTSVRSFDHGLKAAGSEFFDSKDPQLAAFFGLRSTGWVGHMDIEFGALGLPPNGFSSTRVLNGDVKNTPVPEPASLTLLISGLLAFYRKSRRR